MKVRFLFIVLVAILCSCHHAGTKKSYDEIGKSGLTTRTEYLRANLTRMAAHGMMVGHANGTVEGVGWRYDSLHSDIQSCCDDYPAALTFELTGIEKDTPVNADTLLFSAVRQAILQHFKRGGLIVLRWGISTSTNATGLSRGVRRAAAFLASLHDGYGIKVPVLLAIVPYSHTYTANAVLRADSYKNTYRQSVRALQQAGVTNALYLCSLNETMVAHASEIEAYYPGDVYVDALELNYIQTLDHPQAAYYSAKMMPMLKCLSTFALAHGKPWGIRTGMEGIPDKEWWTTTLLPLLQPYKITYLMLGGNKGDRSQHHFCAPFPGNSSTASFVHFYNDPRTLFMSDVNGLYLAHNTKTKR